MKIKAIALAVSACATFSAQAQISGDTIKIGLITDMSGLYTDIDGAHMIGSKICSLLESRQVPHSRSTASQWLTVSIGAACLVPDEGQEIKELIEIADRRLYQAKQQGRNRVVWQDA
jgi:GGDEF domain-containing protein